ncbi:MAG: Smr/MutS family protein [Acidobacteria bacterium]|nr:Smr/MutS family protein [Acidobacteriota bacterium]
MYLAGKTQSPLGREAMLRREPSRDLGWIQREQQLIGELRVFLSGGGSFGLGALFDATEILKRASIPQSALEALEIRRIAEVAELIADWRTFITSPPDHVRDKWPAVTEISSPLLAANFYNLLKLVSGKIEPDGSLTDDASPELGRIRRAAHRQHKAIEDSLRRTLKSFAEEGSLQDQLITVRGERFVIPVKAEHRRRVPGVIHGSSSSGQTVFLEPMETVEQNNELVRLLDEEQAEVHRILVAMTAAVAEHADILQRGIAILARVDELFAAARFAEEMHCTRPVFTDGKTHDEELAFELNDARHPLLALRLRAEKAAITPLTISLPGQSKQLIISGPNTGGKTVSLKTVGLFALMAQAGLPVPASRARLPVFSAIYADIGDAQSIERNLSTFSAHITHVNHIAREADARSLVLLDELGSATDPEEGAALATAIAEHFLHTGAWTFITTHLTSLKIYAAKHEGVTNAAVGFDEATLAPTYELRLGVPGASSGINIAQRLGLEAKIVAAARNSVTTQTADIARFLDDLHTQLTEIKTERANMKAREAELQRERTRLENEGRVEQRNRARELEQKLASLMKDFEYQMREAVNAIGDKAASQKARTEADRRIARLKREFQESFNSVVVAHVNKADKKDPAAQPHVVREVSAGDTVKLKSMGREAKVERVLDAKHFEVSIGPMKMRVAKDDIAAVQAAPVESPIAAAKRKGGINVIASDADSTPYEINVIGRTADEAQDEVSRFVDQAFLAGRPSIRIVHGTGMGILRRTLREFLRKHPHVVTLTEPPYNEGGQGATIVELKQ